MKTFSITLFLLFFLLFTVNCKFFTTKSTLKSGKHQIIQLKLPTVSPVTPKNVIAKSEAPPVISQQSMLAVNTLNLLFYCSLGSVMPFLPVFYKFLGVSGTLELLGSIYVFLSLL
jgi:hypothetical protein